MLKNNAKMSNKAFSLIELSIVLIIIGLLVAGITGGASLITSAKNRALANELMDYEKFMYIFKSIKNRLPGDINGDGKIGYPSSETYKAGDFSAPYDSGAGIPNWLSAPFVDLYLEKVIDFEPKNVSSSTDGLELAANGGIPHFKSFKNYTGYFEMGSYSEDSSFMKYGTREQDVYYTAILSSGSDYASPKTLKYVDEKLDDGIYNTGKIRGGCSGADTYGHNNYSVATNCGTLYYKVHTNL